MFSGTAPVLIILLSPQKTKQCISSLLLVAKAINYCIEGRELERDSPDNELPPPQCRGKEKDTSSQPPPHQKVASDGGHRGFSPPQIRKESGRRLPAPDLAGGGALVSG